MPSAILTACCSPGCRGRGEGRYCPTCKAANGAKRNRLRRETDAASRFRSAPIWQKFRRWFKARHPLCCNPLRLHLDGQRAAEHVHHIKPLAEHPDLAVDEDNCAGLCAACHAAIERMEREGRGTQHLFIWTPPPLPALAE